jgi:hypothetical protein
MTIQLIENPSKEFRPLSCVSSELNLVTVHDFPVWSWEIHWIVHFETLSLLIRDNLGIWAFRPRGSEIALMLFEEHTPVLRSTCVAPSQPAEQRWIYRNELRVVERRTSQDRIVDLAPSQNLTRSTDSGSHSEFRIRQARPRPSHGDYADRHRED